MGMVDLPSSEFILLFNIQTKGVMSRTCFKELDGQTYAGFNASTWWIAPDAILFYQDGLDENVTHSINISNRAAMDLTISSFTVYRFEATADGTSDPSTSITTLSPLSFVPLATSNSPTVSEASKT